MRLFEKLRAHLLWKMVCWFVLFLLLPCLLSAGIYYLVNQNYFSEERSRLEQDALSQYCADVERDLSSCESVYLQIQQHSNFLRFLNGDYRSVPRQLEAYIQEFSTMFSYAESYSPYVDTVRVYMLREGLLEMDKYLKDIESLGDYSLDKQTSQGYWRYDGSSDRLVFRRSLHSISMESTLGIMEITCYPSLLSGKMKGLSASMSRQVCATYGGQTYLLTGDSFQAAEELPALDSALSQELTKLPMVIRLGEAAPTGQGQFNAVTLTAWVALLSITLLSIVYFLRVSRLSRRIVDFSRYISRSFTEIPGSYTDNGHDEFSLLVQNFNLMLENNNQLINQIKLEQLRQNEMAYKVLQAQIDPHFIYNALESIRMLAELHNEPEISDMIFSLSKLMRYTFSANTGEVTIGAELDLVEQYLKIQKMRLEDRLSFRIDCPQELYRYGCPQFIIQPLAENAIKYGLGKGSPAVFVEMCISQKDRRITITVENNGDALEPEKLERINELLHSGEALAELSSGTGVGLDSINSRMRYLYPASFHMELRDPPKNTGLQVVLTWIPEEKTIQEEGGR